MKSEKVWEKKKHVQKKKLIDAPCESNISIVVEEHAHQKILNSDIGADNEGCIIDSSQWTYNMIFSGKKYSAVKI